MSVLCAERDGGTLTFLRAGRLAVFCVCKHLQRMDLEFFVQNYRDDELIGRRICLYIIAPKNMLPSYQQQNFFRAGVAGSRMILEGGRTVTSSGAEVKTSSMHSRAAMYVANLIAGADLRVRVRVRLLP